MVGKPFPSPYSADEAYFIRTTIKNKLDEMNRERIRLMNEDNLVGLMRIEADLSVAEVAWEKLKRLV